MKHYIGQIFQGSFLEAGKESGKEQKVKDRGTLLKCISYPVLCNKFPLNWGAFSQISVSRVWAWLCWLLCFRLSHGLWSCCWSSSYLLGEGLARGLLMWLWEGFIFLQAYMIEGLGALLAAVWRWPPGPCDMGCSTGHLITRQLASPEWANEKIQREGKQGGNHSLFFCFFGNNFNEI